MQSNVAATASNAAMSPGSVPIYNGSASTSSTTAPDDGTAAQSVTNGAMPATPSSTSLTNGVHDLTLSPSDSLQHHQLHPHYAAAQQPSLSASPTFGALSGGARSFSAGNMMANAPPPPHMGMPGSPYLDHQYAAAAAAAAALASATGSNVHQHQQQQQQQTSQQQQSQTVGGSFSPDGTPNLGGDPHASAAYLNAAAAVAAQNPLGAAQLFSHPAFAAAAHNPAAAAAAMAAAAAAVGAVPGGMPGAFLTPHALGILSAPPPPHHHPHHATHHHHHHHHAAAAAAANATGRTVYVGNLPAEASVDELLSQVKFGPIENVRLLPEKNCAFISFLDGTMAAAFHADASVKKMALHNQELKIGWGKPSACPAPILMAVQQNQATRNVYLGQLDDETTESSLRDDLSRFGPIDQVKIVRDKNIGFVHFLSIATAMKVVTVLPNEPAWAGKRVNYGKDRCAYVPKSQQQNQAHNSQAAAMGMAAAASLGYPTGMNPAALNAYNAPVMPSGGGGGGGGGGSGNENRSPGAVASVFAPMASATALQQMGNRTVYLGNIHPDTTTEEICNHIRGGILQGIRFIPEKHIAFITFIESNAALAFYHLASYSGIMVHQRRLKVGWGKHSGPLGPAIAMAVQAGGSRNVYIGNIEDFDVHTVEKLRSDFGEYGETELVNTFREKNCAFVNFCNIQNAIKAIEGMKNRADYKNQRIGAGKDRCGNPPRAVTNTLNAAAAAAAAASGGANTSSGSIGGPFIMSPQPGNGSSFFTDVGASSAASPPLVSDESGVTPSTSGETNLSAVAAAQEDA